MPLSLKLHSQEALVSRLRLNREEGKRTVFLVGSPLTAPERSGQRGVPGVSAIMERARRMLAISGGPTDGSEYQEVFAQLQGYVGQDRVNQLVREAVLEACIHPDEDLVRRARLGDRRACQQLERDWGSWALTSGVEAFGKLLAEVADIFGEHVLTSNFDPLISVAIERAGGLSWQTKLHGEGLLEQSKARGCQVIHVHGYWYGADMLHNPAQLRQARPQLVASLRRLFEHSSLVAVAYGGWNDVFTRSITELVRDGGAFPEILWTFYSEDAEQVGSEAADLLEGLRPGLERGRVDLFGGINCHTLFPHLHRIFGRSTRDSLRTSPHHSREEAQPIVEVCSKAATEAPNFVAGPPIDRDEDFYGRRTQQEELRDAFDLVQPVQILGERRMGKTSLLRWAQRHVNEHRDWPVAWVNAQGPDGRSPEGLVRAIGWALGERTRVETALNSPSPKDVSCRAERLLYDLLPAVLLVDEADALARSGHGFEDGFLETLRAWGQDRQLLWISASIDDLHPQFQSTGLTSSFLNDSRRVLVGQIELSDARKLIAEGLSAVIDAADVESSVDRGIREFGGVAYGLQIFGDEVWRGRSISRAIDRAETTIRQTLGTWWDHRDTGEKEMLTLALRAPAVDALRKRQRLVARTLEARGLLTERDNTFLLPGEVWRSYVAGQ